MSFGKVRIQIQRLERVLFRMWISIFWTNEPVTAQYPVSVCQSRICQREIRILQNCFFKKIFGFSERLFGSFVPEVSSFQIKVVRLSVCSHFTAEPFPLGMRQMNAKFIRDLFRNFLFNTAHLTQLRGVAFSP